jgi:hypothetical protein
MLLLSCFENPGSLLLEDVGLRGYVHFLPLFTSLDIDVVVDDAAVFVSNLISKTSRIDI